MDCRIDNGKVLGSGCWTGCNYTCDSGYRKARPETPLVNCDTTSGRWLLPGIKSAPCQKYFRSHETEGSYSRNSLNSELVGSIAGSIGGIILLIGLYRTITRIARYSAQRQLREVIQRKQDEATQRLNADVSSDNSRTNANQDNDSRNFFVFRIRRFFTSTMYPIMASRNPPEPPAYDAESAAPPVHEESKRARLGPLETISNVYQLEDEAIADRRQESPLACEHTINCTY